MTETLKAQSHHLLKHIPRSATEDDAGPGKSSGSFCISSVLSALVLALLLLLFLFCYSYDIDILV
jgi:hypothetical protein